MATGSVDIGARVRVKFKAIVGRKPSPGLSACNMVTETESSERWVHYLYLPSGKVSGNKDAGGEAEAAFYAEVTGQYGKSPNGTTQVRELDGSGNVTGFTHYLFLGSDAVTPAEPEAEPGPAVDKSRRAEKGDKVFVDLIARVTGDARSARSLTSEAEEEGEPYTHFFYLGSDGVKRRIEKLYGAYTYKARFTALVTGEPGGGEAATTEVREILKDGVLGATHYVYLGSGKVNPLVTEAVTVRRARQGEKVTVEIAGGRVIGSGRTDRLNTTEVLEDGNGSTHYLFLPSSRVTVTSGRVTARFTALVDAEPGAGPSATTEVRELDSTGYPVCTHYLFLGSPSVSLVTEKTAQLEPELAAGKPAPDDKAVKRDTGGTRILPGLSRVFESKDVLNRIAELEGGPATEFIITRARTGEKFGFTLRFTTRAAADEYLDNLDYNVSRFVIEPVPVILSDEDRAELDMLRALNDAGRARFGPTLWVTSSVRLLSDESLDENWARQEAASRLGISISQTDNWPLSGIDWDEAVQELLDAEYYSVMFGLTTYWGQVE